jgi:hypothetical protein
MNLESAGPWVAFGAAREGALEGFLPSVGQLMSLQMSLSYKLLVTLAADEGSLSSVGPHVGLQISGLWKFLQACLKRTYQDLLLFFRSLNFLDLGYKWLG